MTTNKQSSRRPLKSNLPRVDEHRIKRSEYDELPELTEEMLRRSTVKKAGVPFQPIPEG